MIDRGAITGQGEMVSLWFRICSMSARFLLMFTSPTISQIGPKRHRLWHRFSRTRHRQENFPQKNHQTPDEGEHRHDKQEANERGEID